ncbi:MAG: homocysteine S-methyltransferase family protein [bacterium]|nr:homocysteine S-methyltransferase family protein [bacterium]
MVDQTARRGLLQRLEEDAVICAEGYLFELERRGYLQAGAFVPEVVLEYPEAVAALHREFLRAGSDVIEALTYYGHREKLRLIGKEDLLEPLQRNALVLAHSIASEAEGEPPLVAGNICNTNIWHPDEKKSDDLVRTMFEEQVGWAADARVDFIIAETFSFLGEAQIALETVKAFDLPVVATLTLHRDEYLRDDVQIEEAVKQLEQAGADVVGLNCARGPNTMMPLLKRVREAVSCHVAALPVPYRTSKDHPTMQSLRDPDCGCIPDDRPFPTALDPFTCNRYEIADFAKEAYDLNVRYLGVCCGGAPHHVRAIAEALGRFPAASRYSPDMSKHYAFGKEASLKKYNQDNIKNL